MHSSLFARCQKICTMMRLIVAATALSITTMAASAAHHGRYKLLHKSKAGKAFQSKSTKSSVLGKSKSADTSKTLVHRPKAFKSSKATMEILLPLEEQPSPSPSLVVSELTTSVKQPSPHPVVSSTNSPTPTALATTHRPSHHAIFSPYVNDTAPVMTETMKPSPSPIHNLFTPNDGADGGHASNDDSSAPSTTQHDSTTSPAPSSTTPPSGSPYTNIPSVVSSVMDPSASPVGQGHFGSNDTVPSTEDSTTTNDTTTDTTASPTPTTTEDSHIISTSNAPTLKPSSSSNTTPSPTSKASFSFTVILSSQTSFIPSYSPSESYTPSSSSNPSFSSSHGSTFSNAPTTSKQLNLLNPLSQDDEDKVQVLASIMVILACAMAILGTLYGVFRTMTKDEESVLDVYGAQLAGAADFDADDIIGNVNVMEGGGGMDSHLQLVTE
jgi:hypothetical protein